MIWKENLKNPYQQTLILIASEALFLNVSQSQDIDFSNEIKVRCKNQNTEGKNCSTTLSERLKGPRQAAKRAKTNSKEGYLRAFSSLSPKRGLLVGFLRVKTSGGRFEGSVATLG